MAVVQHPDENNWVRQAQTGDRQAFAALVDRYWGRIYRWLHSLTHNAHVAEDLTQDVFLKAWAALPGLQEPATFRPWLFCIARNGLINLRRGPRGAPVQHLPESISSVQPDPAEEAIVQEGRALLKAACDRLPVLFRGAFLLWTQEDMAYPEIAQALEVTEETARWRVCKARQFLLKELEVYLDRKKS